MRRLASLTFALALALCIWAPVAAIAEGGVEQDTMTEEFEVATQGSNQSNQGGKTNGSGSSSTSTGSRSPLARTGDETSMLIPACLAGAALGALALGKAARE